MSSISFVSIFSVHFSTQRFRTNPTPPIQRYSPDWAPDFFWRAASLAGSTGILCGVFGSSKSDSVYPVQVFCHPRAQIYSSASSPTQLGRTEGNHSRAGATRRPLRSRDRIFAGDPRPLGRSRVGGWPFLVLFTHTFTCLGRLSCLFPSGFGILRGTSIHLF
jgi:hypothetical protein